MHHVDKSAHHLLAGREVGNHTVAQRTDGANILLSLLIHPLGLIAYGNHLVGAAIESHSGRLINNDLIITDNDGVCRSKVHGYFLDKAKKSHISLFRSLNCSMLISRTTHE